MNPFYDPAVRITNIIVAGFIIIAKAAIKGAKAIIKGICKLVAAITRAITNRKPRA